MSNNVKTVIRLTMPVLWVGMVVAFSLSQSANLHRAAFLLGACAVISWGGMILSHVLKLKNQLHEQTHGVSNYRLLMAKSLSDVLSAIIVAPFYLLGAWTLCHSHSIGIALIGWVLFVMLGLILATTLLTNIARLVAGGRRARYYDDALPTSKI
jgi:hypothetical protein